MAPAKQNKEQIIKKILKGPRQPKKKKVVTSPVDIRKKLNDVAVVVFSFLLLIATMFPLVISLLKKDTSVRIEPGTSVDAWTVDCLFGKCNAADSKDESIPQDSTVYIGPDADFGMDGRYSNGRTYLCTDDDACVMDEKACLLWESLGKRIAKKEPDPPSDNFCTGSKGSCDIPDDTFCMGSDICKNGICVGVVDMYPHKDFFSHHERGELHCNSTEPTMLMCEGGCTFTSEELHQIISKGLDTIKHDNFLGVPRDVWMLYRTGTRDKRVMIQEFVTAEYNMFNGACQTPLIFELVAEARRYIERHEEFNFLRDKYAESLYFFMKKYNDGEYGGGNACTIAYTGKRLPLNLAIQAQRIEAASVDYELHQPIYQDCVWVK